MATPIDRRLPAVRPEDIALNWDELFKPTPEETPSEWCERCLTVGGAMPGPFSLRYHPWAREIIDSICSKKYRKVILKTGAQAGKTTILLACLAWWCAHHVNSPSMWVMPNENLAASFSRDRMRPFLESCEEIRKKIPSRKHDINQLYLGYIGTPVRLTGSNSPANLMSVSTEFAVIDEVEACAEASSDQSSSIQLLTERLKAWASPVMVLSSTPTTSNTEFSKLYNSSTSEEFHCRCPHCNGDMGPWDFGNVKFDKPTAENALGQTIIDYNVVKATARFECPLCKHAITHQEKFTAMKNGFWSATNPSPYPDTRSFHMNSLAAPLLTWADLSLKFLSDLENGSLQSWQNNYMAMEWYGVNETSPELIAEACRYEGDITKGVMKLMAVDCQLAEGGTFYCTIVGADIDNQKIVAIDAQKKNSWEEVTEFQRFHQVPDNRVLVDIGWSPSEAKAQCLFHSKPLGKGGVFSGWIAARGVSIGNKQGFRDKNLGIYTPTQAEYIDASEGIAKVPQKILCIKFISTLLKDKLEFLRSGKSPVGFEVAPQLMDVSRSPYLAHLAAEMKMPDKKGRMIWQQISKRPNHFLDGTVMCLAMIIQSRIFKNKLQG